MLMHQWDSSQELPMCLSESLRLKVGPDRPSMGRNVGDIRTHCSSYNPIPEQQQTLQEKCSKTFQIEERTVVERGSKEHATLMPLGRQCSAALEKWNQPIVHLLTLGGHKKCGAFFNKLVKKV